MSVLPGPMYHLGDLRVLGVHLRGIREFPGQKIRLLGSKVPRVEESSNLCWQYLNPLCVLLALSQASWVLRATSEGVAWPKPCTPKGHVSVGRLPLSELTG